MFIANSTRTRSPVGGRLVPVSPSNTLNSCPDAPQSPAWRRPTPRARAVRDLHRATGRLSTAAMARMDDDMPWFAELSAEDRSWVG